MIIRLTDKIIELGSSVHQYFPRQNWAFIKGEVTDIEGTLITIDFADTVFTFCIHDIFYAIDTDLGEEVFVTAVAGRLQSDYRTNVLKSGLMDEVSVECRRRRAVRPKA